MSVFVVTWDLNREKPNYAQARASFVKHLEAFDNTRDAGLDSVRFISAASSAAEIEGHLRQKLDADDRLFVTRLIAGGHQGWLSKSVWAWINQRL